MKKLKTECVLLAVGALFSFSSCNEKKAADTPAAENVVEEAPVQEEPEPEVVAPVVEEKKTEKVVEVEKPAPKEEKPAPEPEKVVEAPKAEEPKPVETKAQVDEYTRSVGDISVSKDDFAKDKKEILRIIEELDVIMRDKNYSAWLTYIDSESIEYWQKPANLKKAQKRLPVKGLSIRNLQDYFRYVFIPSRQGRTISEIRYESSTYVKAVQVVEEEDIVFYYFNKINGKWMLHLPPIEK